MKPKPIIVTIGSQDAIVIPAMQRRSFNVVRMVNQAADKGKPLGPKGTMFNCHAPSVLWEHDGGIALPRDSVPSLVAFFRSL